MLCSHLTLQVFASLTKALLHVVALKVSLGVMEFHHPSHWQYNSSSSIQGGFLRTRAYLEWNLHLKVLWGTGHGFVRLYCMLENIKEQTKKCLEGQKHLIQACGLRLSIYAHRLPAAPSDARTDSVSLREPGPKPPLMRSSVGLALTWQMSRDGCRAVTRNAEQRGW